MATAQLEAVFAPDPGFQQLRTVRQMIFVDFYDIPTATASMRLHQNHFFEGFPAEQVGCRSRQQPKRSFSQHLDYCC